MTLANFEPFNLCQLKQYLKGWSAKISLCYGYFDGGLIATA